MVEQDALVERLTSHMGKAEMADVLSDCRAAAAHIAGPVSVAIELLLEKRP